MSTQKKIVPTDEEIVATIDKIVRRLAKKFRFGYFTTDDIKQEIAVLCMEAMPKYDGLRPLENFLWTNAHNRLCNLKRDKYERRDKPCLKCPLYDPKRKKSKSECLKFENKNDCDLYSRWLIRNEKKKNLVNSSVDSSATVTNNTYEDDYSNIDTKKIMDLLDKYIPVSMRADFIRYKYGFRLNKIKQDILLEEIRRICKEHGVIKDVD